jgi:hypothetical protein
MSDDLEGTVEESDSTPSVGEFTKASIRDTLGETINEAFTTPGWTLIEALPSMGKSYGVIEWAAESGEPLTVLTSRRELYDQYTEWADEEELSSLQLPTFQHDCPTMNDGGEAAEAAREIYETGITGKEIHDRSEYYFGQPLPCQKDGECPYIERRAFDPAEYDVLIGHYLQAHNPEYIEDRYVAIDEFPQDDYLFTPTHNDVASAVSNYLENQEQLPFDSWKRLQLGQAADSVQDAIEEWQESQDGIYGAREAGHSFQQSPSFHARAPLMIEATLEFEFLENDWEYADLGNGRVAVRSPEDEWAFLLPPPLHYAESVIALDGTPTVSRWRLALGGGFIEHKEVLETDWEKRKYLSEVLGLGIVRTESGTKPYAGGGSVNPRSDGALLEAVQQRETATPKVITSKAAEETYDEEGVSHLIEGSEHYGNLKGSNEFAEDRLGVVIGCPHPPESSTIERWGALDEAAVGRVEEDDGSHKGNLDFGSAYGNALYHGFVHNEVLQAVMRFGREEVGGERGARVYVHTSCLPSWVRPDHTISVTTWSDGMQEVVETIKTFDDWQDGEWTNKEIAEHTTVGVKQVGELMKELDEHGYVTHYRGGQGNRYNWSDVRLDEFTEFGHVGV